MFPVTTSWPASSVCTSEILPNVHTNWRSMGITLITEHRSAIQSRTLPKAQVRRCTSCNVQPNLMGLLQKSEEAHFLCENSNSMIFVTKKCYPQKCHSEICPRFFISDIKSCILKTEYKIRKETHDRHALFNQKSKRHNPYTKI